MKSFYGFLTLIISMLVFSACSESPADPEDSFQGQRYGNWITTSETSAEWVGSAATKPSNQTSAADTVYYSSPNENGLELLHVDNLFAVQYRDSSTALADFQNGVIPTFYDPFENLQGQGGSFGGIDGVFFEAAMTITNFSCDSTYNFDAKDNFRFSMQNDEKTIDQVIIIDSNGVVDAMQAIGC